MSAWPQQDRDVCFVGNSAHKRTVWIVNSAQLYIYLFFIALHPGATFHQINRLSKVVEFLHSKMTIKNALLKMITFDVRKQSFMITIVRIEFFNMLASVR